jgi:hypothetical protein
MRAIAEKIEIRPIPNKQNIREFSSNLEFFGGNNTIGCYVNSKSHKFETNLDEDDIEYLKESGFPYDVTNNYIAGKPHPFWDSTVSKLTLLSSTVILSPTANLLDFIKYRYLQKSRFIYISEEEMLSGTKPEATHFIYDESKEIKVKATVLETQNNLIKKVANLSTQRKKDIILIILNETTDNKDADYLTVRMDDIIQDKNYVEQLRKLLEESDNSLSLSSIIKKAILSNVLSRTKQGYFYFENNLGFSEEDVKEFLSKDENQEILISIQTKIN